MFANSHGSIAEVNVSVVYRQDTAKRRQPVFKFTHRSKISIFAPIHCTDLREIWHAGPLNHAKFHANQCTGVGTRPKNGKKFHFLVKSPPRKGEPFDQFLQLLGLLYAELSQLAVA